ncbi:MAG: hypothetical protein HYR80_10060, partial [Nitrospirae bacterium]|nr:hypothetical protein [Nitrospirota bacterium]
MRIGRLMTFVIVTFSLALTREAMSQNLTLLPGEQVPILKDVQVKADVTLEDNLVYSYSYEITNPQLNTGRIWLAGIDIKKPAGSKELNRSGLVNGPRYTENSSEMILSAIGSTLIPVGSSSPENWTSGLTMDGTISWGSFDSPFRIQPGQSLSGFKVTSHGLPGIRSILIKPKFEQTPVDEATSENLERIKQIEGSIVVQQKTIGPTAPPQNFVALDFTNYIISLRGESQAQRWILQPDILPALDSKLNTVKNSLIAGDNAIAYSSITDFINEVESQKNIGLTSEGYALLKFNAIYLRDQLFQQLPADSVAPVTTAEASPVANEAGWNKTDTIITLTAADNEGGSGVKEIRYSLGSGAEVITVGASVTVPVTTEGETPLRYHAVDQAGNSEAEKTLTIKIDKTPPIINTSANPPANAAGWNNADVTVTFIATDSLSGNTTCTPASFVVSSEGANQSISATCRDQAGNSSSASYSVSLDKTAPTLTFGSLSPLPNAAGWNRSDVTVGFSAADALSGLLSTQPASSPLVFNSDGTGMTRSVTVTDKAGNSATFTSPVVNRDTIAPTLTFGTGTPAPNAAGWNNTNVSVPFTTQDERSGIAGSSISSPLVLSAEGTAVTLSVTVIDQAGNQATLSSPSYKIDKTAPVLTLPSFAASYLLNSSLPLSFSASDSLSQVSTLAGAFNGASVSSGASVLLTQVGANTFTLSATDQAGNSASQSRPFSVLYGFGGFLPPVDENDIYQLGRTLPTKFKLTDVNGASVSTAVAHLSMQ